MKLRLSLLLLLIARPAHAILIDCGPAVDLVVGTECIATIANLRPTQPDVGKREVKRKAQKDRRLKKEDPTDFQEYRRVKTVPVVVGPDGELYLVDHHHSTLAFEKIGETQAYVRIERNYTQLAAEQPIGARMRLFWDTMIADGLAWIEREDGTLLDPLTSAEWPKKLSECGNNRLRAIAGRLVKEGVVEKKSRNFFEFFLARFFRDQWIDANELGYSEAYQKARKLLKSKPGKKAWARFQCLAHSVRAVAGD